MSAEVLARLKPFGISFERLLTDLIKGIRTHSKDSPELLLAFLNNAIQECKDELTTTDLEIKATAVLKLAYLEMYGYDMSWCNFQILEVMSAAKFQQKRIGYLAAMQLFKSEQDLLILATNQFKKDLNSHNHIEIGLALSGIATIVTPNLAKDIVDDVVMKLTHLKPYIRKKAVLALFKIFLQYPESWKLALPRIVDKLDDSDISVVSATITVVCEISKKNPTAFLGYLPKFFTILEETTNNWLIIRILKLFQSLLKIEPRMKKRIMPSIVGLMAKTEATSLIYECINCIVDGGMISPDSSRDREVAKSCVDHLLKFFNQGDANLRFVGLLALIKIVHIFPSFIHKQPEVSLVINACLQEKDLIVKRKALEICHYLVTEDTIAGLVKTLLLQILPENIPASCPESFKLEITTKILEITSADNYNNIPNFKWYVVALKELVNLTLLAESSSIADEGKVTLSQGMLLVIASKIGNEFKSLAMKVPLIRSFIVTKVILDYTQNVRLLQSCPVLMKDLYWIMGEYLDDYGLQENEEGDDDLDATTSLSQKVTIFNALVNKHIDEKLNSRPMFPVSQELSRVTNADVITSATDALVKLYSSMVSDYRKLYSHENKLPYDRYCDLAYFLLKLIRFLETWETQPSYEVQERCSSWLEYLKLCRDSLKNEGAEEVEGVEKLEKEEMEYYKKLSLESARENESEGDFDEDSLDEVSSSDDLGQSDDDEESDDDEKSEESDDDDDDAKSSQEMDGPSEDKMTELNPTEFEPRQLPALLTKILPSFFKSYPLNPIAATAQTRIQVPHELDLETVINAPPLYCLEPDDNTEISRSSDDSDDDEDDEKEDKINNENQAKDRLERLKDDPYYLTASTKKKTSKAKSRIVNLEGDMRGASSEVSSGAPSLIDLSETVAEKPKKSRKLKKEKVLVLSEDTLGGADDDSPVDSQAEKKKEKKTRKNKLIIDTLNLESLSLDSSDAEKTSGSKAFEYDVDLSHLRSKLADESVKKAEKKKERKDKKERKKDKKDTKETKEKGRSNPGNSTNAEKSGAQSEETETSNALPSPKTGDLLDGGVLVSTDTLVSVPQKSKKKKKRAVIED